MRHVTTDMVWWSESSRLDFPWPLPSAVVTYRTLHSGGPSGGQIWFGFPRKKK